MPLTPFHAAVPWLAYVRWPALLSFWALTLGAMVPDLEVPVYFAAFGDIYEARGPMHSLIGAVTIDAAVAALAVWILVPPVTRWIDRKWPGTDILTFAGQDLRKDRRDLGAVYGSAALGALTHVVVDVPTHGYNPLFWPWQETPLKIVPYADELWYDVVTSILWIAFFVIVFRAYWRR